MTTRDISKDVDELKADMQKLREDVGHLVAALKTKAQETATVGVDKVRDGLSDAREYGEQMYKEVGKKVEERPITSLLVAFGIGMVLGKMMDHRRGA
jgi:ElaB/YqjD/DUF883 family membrane-anchored ribosome-binding protein